ncbi:hypothetical protein [Amycolatopsis sp. WGS_07]
MLRQPGIGLGLCVDECAPGVAEQSLRSLGMRPSVADPARAAVSN